jgi:hypothetical protein
MSPPNLQRLTNYTSPIRVNGNPYRNQTIRTMELPVHDSERLPYLSVLRPSPNQQRDPQTHHGEPPPLHDQTDTTNLSTGANIRKEHGCDENSMPSRQDVDDATPMSHYGKTTTRYSSRKKLVNVTG